MVVDTPRFGAGEYELVLVRDAPLRDDSLAARAEVDTAYDWRTLDLARTRADSTRALIALINTQDSQWGEDRRDLASARTADDSSRVIHSFFRSAHCISWLVGRTLHLSANGRLTEISRRRQYCRGEQPPYTLFEGTNTDSLQRCERWTPARPGRILHLTCDAGRYQDDFLGFRHVGDTLVLGRDCDGRDTFVLRRPASKLIVAAAGELRTDREC
jgi:hypothetical protein